MTVVSIYCIPEFIINCHNLNSILQFNFYVLFLIIYKSTDIHIKCFKMLLMKVNMLYESFSKCSYPRSWKNKENK